MISRVEEDNLNLLLEICKKDYFGTRISATALTYGTKYNFAEYWIQWVDDIAVAVLGRLNSNFTLCVIDDSEILEMNQFVTMLYGVETLFCDEKYAKVISMEILKSGSIMEFRDDCFVCNDALVSNPTVSQAYELLKRCKGESISLPNFDEFYVDVTRRLNNNNLHISGCEEQGRLVSVAMTSSETKTTAIISGVATLPQKRGQGFAKKTVKQMLSILLKEKECIALFRLKDENQHFYESLGFNGIGKWIMLTNKVR